MKIHMVSEHASPLAVLGGVDAGGQNVHVADLARALGRLGHEVVVHTRRDDPSLPERTPFSPGVTVRHVDAGPARPIPKDELLPYMGQLAAGLAQDWADDAPDVVHSHFWMSGVATVRAARPLGIPVLHTYHAHGSEKRRQQGAADTSPAERIPLERRLARRAACVIATTDAERRMLVADGAPVGRVEVVPCGVDLDRFRADGPAVPAPGSRPRVVVVGRLVERKGIGNVIEAVARVPDVELLVAGGPSPGLLDDDPAARRLLDLARRLGAGDRVHLLGAVERHRVPDLIRSASVVACCPWYEPFGLVAIEAMACGVPVLATSVGGLAESVQDGVTGRFVPPRRPAAIASALVDLLRAPCRLDAMGRAATRRAQRYGWDAVAAETAAIAERVGTARAMSEGTAG